MCQLKIISNMKAKFLFFKNNSFLILKIKNGFYYIKLNSAYKLIKKGDDWLLSFSGESLKNFCFCNVFIIILRLQKFCRNLLVFKGLGLKIFKNKEKGLRHLFLKLGYSHLCKLHFKRGVDIKVRKKFILLQSLRKKDLGNFAFKIKALKMPNCYNGKGIWYKKEKIKLKIVKKKK